MEEGLKKCNYRLPSLPQTYLPPFCFAYQRQIHWSQNILRAVPYKSVVGGGGGRTEDN